MILPSWTSSRPASGPFLAEDIGAGQAAIAADDHQAVDAVPEQVVGGCAASFARAEGLAAGRADDRAAALQDAADRIPGHLADRSPPSTMPW